MRKEVRLILSIGFLILIIQILPSIRMGALSDQNDYWPTEKWENKSPEELGLNSAKLDEMNLYIAQNFNALNSIILTIDGYIVKEQYFHGWNLDLDHPLYSVTKSITSAIVGIAIEQEYFSLNDSVIDFFPDKTFLNLDSRKMNITVQHLLQMRSGLAWNEWNVSYSVPTNLYRQLMASEDWVQFMMDMKMATDPGQKFVYHSGCSYLLLAIVQKTINTTVIEFAERFLFDPIGIDLSIWSMSPDDIPMGGSHLNLSPRDMARFGYLYLNNGTWDEKQIISKEWVLTSIYDYYELDLDAYYGYQWWIEPEKFGYFSFYASGYLGQKIFVIPDLKAVIVFTGESSNLDYVTLVKEYIIPAIVGTEGTSTKTTVFSVNIILMSLIFGCLIKRRKSLQTK